MKLRIICDIAWNVCVFKKKPEVKNELGKSLFEASREEK